MSSRQWDFKLLLTLKFAAPAQKNGNIIYFIAQTLFLIFWKLYVSIIKLDFSTSRKLYFMEMLMIKSEGTK